ncbi:MAG: hypothetical protein GY820_31715 [Gammaproteobacteria bacterium]|nr:hypothetical protein [Gammaproteobacteria bacterium]
MVRPRQDPNRVRGAHGGARQKTIGPAPRKDPNIHEFIAHTKDESSAVEYAKELGMYVKSAQEAPLAHNPAQQVRKEYWGMCNVTGPGGGPFNRTRPNCHGSVVTILRKGRPQYRCQTCGKQLSQANGSAVISHTTDTRGCFFSSISAVADRPVMKLPIMQVLFVIYAFALDIPSKTSRLLLGSDIGEEAICDWRNYIRDLFSWARSRHPKMGGLGWTVEIDESLFRGRAKYGVGRRLQGTVINR